MLILATTEREYPWGTLRSTHASKVKVILEEKKLEYRVDRLHPGDLWKKPAELVAKHPMGKVPYLELGDGSVIFDSTVINEYLEDRYPHIALKPNRDYELADLRMQVKYAGEAFLVGDLPRIWMPYWVSPEKRDEAEMEAGRQGLRSRGLVYLESRLAGRKFVCGDFSLADAPYMAVAMVLEVDGMALDDFPECAAYFNRLRQRPSYGAISPKTSLAGSAGHGDS
jgi:glutathione S-transferase